MDDKTTWRLGILDRLQELFYRKFFVALTLHTDASGYIYIDSDATTTSYPDDTKILFTFESLDKLDDWLIMQSKIINSTNGD